METKMRFEGYEGLSVMRVWGLWGFEGYDGFWLFKWLLRINVYICNASIIDFALSMIIKL